MSDSLRDRIAAALSEAVVAAANAGKPVVSFRNDANMTGATVFVDCNPLADAVIAELGLRRSDMGEWDVLANGFRGYRYVTGWEADE